jgi:hypothetical protein
VANHYYGITIPGADPGDVVKSTSTTSKNVELVVLDGVTGRNKMQLIRAIERIRDYILTDSAPA